jgi:O-antigen/teichoic acid export membrane protein
LALRDNLRANLGALVGSHAIGLLVPLLTVPYLARTLHPAGWAPVLLAQALAAWVVMLLDYGFELSGARAVATARAAGRELAAVVWRIQGAKLLLLPLGALLLLGAAWALPALRADGALVAWALLFALARGGTGLAALALAAQREDPSDPAGRITLAQFFAQNIASGSAALETAIVQGHESVLESDAALGISV